MSKTSTNIEEQAISTLPRKPRLISRNLDVNSFSQQVCHFLSADLVTRTTGVGIHIGVGSILTRTTAIILTRTILRMRTIMTIAPYQEGDSLAPDPSVILFNNRPSRFTGLAALCFTTL
jgi:hypothetical protein